MSEQRHQVAAGCSGAQQASFYCSRAVEETLASCFDLGPGQSGCGQMMTGPVDVEDLGSFCNFSSQPQNQYTNRCDYVQPQQQQQQQQVPAPGPMQVQMPMHQEVVGQPYYAPMNLEEAAFAYCTDSRWMACPATSYCPLYDVSQQPLESWQALPCAQDFCGYYMTDEDALEEYLCV